MTNKFFSILGGLFVYGIPLVLAVVLVIWILPLLSYMTIPFMMIYLIFKT